MGIIYKPRLIVGCSARVELILQTNSAPNSITVPACGLSGLSELQHTCGAIPWVSSRYRRGCLPFEPNTPIGSLTGPFGLGPLRGANK